MIFRYLFRSGDAQNNYKNNNDEINYFSDALYAGHDCWPR